MDWHFLSFPKPELAPASSQHRPALNGYSNVLVSTDACGHVVCILCLAYFTYIMVSSTTHTIAAATIALFLWLNSLLLPECPTWSSPVYKSTGPTCFLSLAVVIGATTDLRFQTSFKDFILISNCVFTFVSMGEYEWGRGAWRPNTVWIPYS